MDEYITRNNVISAACFGCNLEFSEKPCEPSDCAIRQSIMSLPTADVAPRAELAREIFEEIENEINNDLKKNKKVLPQIEISNVLWNRVSGRINALQGVLEYIAELKKKYTEDN